MVDHLAENQDFTYRKKLKKVNNNLSKVLSQIPFSLAYNLNNRFEYFYGIPKVKINERNIEELKNTNYIGFDFEKFVNKEPDQNCELDKEKYGKKKNSNVNNELHLSRHSRCLKRSLRKCYIVSTKMTFNDILKHKISRETYNFILSQKRTFKSDTKTDNSSLSPIKTDTYEINSTLHKQKDDKEYFLSDDENYSDIDSYHLYSSEFSDLDDPENNFTSDIKINNNDFKISSQNIVETYYESKNLEKEKNKSNTKTDKNKEIFDITSVKKESKEQKKDDNNNFSGKKESISNLKASKTNKTKQENLKYAQTQNSQISLNCYSNLNSSSKLNPRFSLSIPFNQIGSNYSEFVLKNSKKQMQLRSINNKKNDNLKQKNNNVVSYKKSTKSIENLSSKKVKQNKNYGNPQYEQIECIDLTI